MLPLPIRPILFLAALLALSPPVLAAGQQDAASPDTVQTTPVSKPSPARSHTVKTGDWLSKIAVKYGTTVDAIMASNGLKDDGIDIGDVLVIPATSAALNKASSESARSLGRSASVTSMAPKKPTPVALPVEQKQKTVAPSVPTVAASMHVDRDQLDEGAMVTTKTTKKKAEAAPRSAEAVDQRLSDDSRPSNAMSTIASPAEQALVEGAERAKTVEIPTLVVPTVKPLSRAISALGLGGLVLLAMLAHPRTRRLLLDRVRAGRGSSSDIEERIDVLSQCNVGTGQRILSLSVDGHRLVVGVSPGRMDVLHRWATAGNAEEGEVAGEGTALLASAVQPAASGGGQFDDTSGDETRNLGGVNRPFGAATARLATVSLGFGDKGIDPFDTTSQLPTLQEQPVAHDGMAATAAPTSQDLMSLWATRGDSQDRSLQPDDDDSWWMEGATETEMDRLHEGESSTEAPRLSPAEGVQADMRRDRAAHEVLATLRTRRIQDDEAEQTSSEPVEAANGSPARVGRRVARLGRPSRLNSGAAAAASNGKGPASTGTVRRML